jgi:hypothetical protein
MGAREDFVLRHIRQAYGGIIRDVCRGSSWDEATLAAIMCRESEGGLSPLLDQVGPAGRGDNGHGHGLCQIDDRSFPAFCSSSGWADPKGNITQARLVLEGKLGYIERRMCWTAISDELLRHAAIAAYNAGEGRVVRDLLEGLDPDAHTAHQDYGREVLRIAQRYRELEILDRESAAKT